MYLTDVSSETVTAVLPAYLVLGLHLSYAQYGVLEGLSTGATAFTRLLGGYCADRFDSRKLLAEIGLLGLAGPWPNVAASTTRPSGWTSAGSPTQGSMRATAS